MKPIFHSPIALIVGLIALVLHEAPASAGVISTADAISYWGFEQSIASSDGRAGTYAFGSSASPDYVTDRFGNAQSALSLRGDRDVLNVANAAIPEFLTDFSISVWFRMDNHNPNGGRSVLFDTRRSGGTYNNNGAASVIGFIDDGIDPPTGINPSEGYFGTFNRQDLELADANSGEWHNIFFSVTGNTNQSIFYNGVSISSGGTNATGPSPSTFGLDLTFGDTGIDANGRGFNFRGDLDDIAIWNQSFSATEVREFYFGLAHVPAPGSGLLMILGLYPLVRARKR